MKKLFTLLTMLIIAITSSWAAVNNTTVTKAGTTQKYIDVKTTAASSGDEVTVSKKYIAYTCAELVANTIKGVWYTQQSSGSGSSATDAVSITGYRSACNKYLPVKSGNTQTFYVTNCKSFAMLYDPRSSGRYLTITATNMDDNTDTKTITNSGSVSSGTKYNVELTGLDASKYYMVEVVTNATSDSRFFQIRLEAPLDTYTVTYKANNGTSEADVTDEAASSVAECSNTWTVPTGKTFNGWNTEANGTGDAYAVGATVSSDLTLYAQWANIATLFSMTSITGPTTDIASQGKASVTATFSTGGSAELFNANATNPALMVVSGYIKLASSGNSYCHVSFPTKLQAGDVIALGETTGNAYLGTTSTKPSSKVVLPYTIPTNSSFVGATDLYIFNNKDDGDEEKVYQFNEFTVKGAAEASDLTITSSTPVNLNIGGTSTITTNSSSSGDITFASSDANVATVSDEGVITAVGSGTATITISQAAKDTYRAGATKVTVTVVETAMIKVKLNGTGAATVTGNISGVSAEKSGIEDGNKFGKGAYVTLTLPTGYTFQAGDILNVNITTASSGGKVIKIYDPEHKDEDHVWYNTNKLGVVGDNKFVLPAALEGKSSFSICRTSGNGWNAKVAYISVTRPNAVITLNASGFATYSSATDFEYFGADAYGMKLTENSLSGTKVIAGKIKAGEGILFKGDANAKVYILETAGAEEISDNDLMGTTPATGDAPAPDYTNHKYFVLKGNTFKPYSGTNFTANKACFKVDKDFALNSLDITFDDAPTAVEAVAEAKVNVNVPVKVIKNGQLFIGNYNVAGARVK